MATNAPATAADFGARWRARFHRRGGRVAMGWAMGLIGSGAAGLSAWLIGDVSTSNGDTSLVYKGWQPSHLQRGLVPIIGVLSVVLIVEGVHLAMRAVRLGAGDRDVRALCVSVALGLLLGWSYRVATRGASSTDSMVRFWLVVDVFLVPFLFLIIGLLRRESPGPEWNE